MHKTRIALAAGLLLVVSAVRSAGQQADIVASSSTGTPAFREISGRRLTYICPAKFEYHNVWGTDTYKDDSSICNAAIHAGVLTRDQGGVVTLVTRAAQSKFVGSKRNGIESIDSEPVAGSFSFVHDATVGQLDWSTTAAGIPAAFNQPVDLVCPPGGPAPVGHTIWGSDVYADDSSICNAAVHAGLITRARGGAVTLEARGQRTKFAGGTRNGILSAPYDGARPTFSFAGLTVDSLDNVTARTRGMRDSLDNRGAIELYNRISRTTITTPTSSGATRQLSLSILDAAGTQLSVTDAQRAMLPVRWTTSNASCVGFISGSATGTSVTAKSLGCPATVTATVLNPAAGKSSTAPAKRTTTLQLK